MELQELMDEIDGLRPDDEEPRKTMYLLQLKLGQIADALMRIEDIEEHVEESGKDFPKRRVQQIKRDMFAGLVSAAFEFAAEHEIDVERAIDDRIAHMKEVKRQIDLHEKASHFDSDVDTDLEPEDDRTFF